MQPEIAKQILEKNKEDWEYLTDEFAVSRASNWPEIKPLTKYVKSGDKILDLGCGNGRLFTLFQSANVEYTGLDSCERLIEAARKNFQFPISNFQTNSKFQIPNSKPQFIVSSALNLPFKNEEFDVIFSIAVFHHIPSNLFRERVLAECYRVLKPGGYLILTTWNLWQPKLLLKYKIWQTFALRAMSLLRITNPLQIYKLRIRDWDWGDVFIPWKERKGTIYRYYHIFTFKELKKIIKNAGFGIIDNYYTRRGGGKTNLLTAYNLAVVAQK